MFRVCDATNVAPDSECLDWKCDYMVDSFYMESLISGEEIANWKGFKTILLTVFVPEHMMRMTVWKEAQVLSVMLVGQLVLTAPALFPDVGGCPNMAPGHF